MRVLVVDPSSPSGRRAKDGRLAPKLLFIGAKLVYLGGHCYFCERWPSNIPWRRPIVITFFAASG